MHKRGSLGTGPEPPYLCGMRNYVAALCDIRDGALVTYDSTGIAADSDDDARRQAREWAAKLDFLEEPAWLQLIDASGNAILSEPCGPGA